MKEILIFAGTTEGRKLSELLAEAGIPHTVCVATEYGEIVLREHPLRNVHCGRMAEKDIREYISAGNFAAVVDATHPYASVITENIKTAMQGSKLPYLRLKRESAGAAGSKSIVFFDTNEACAEALREVEGNILLTTGSKELSKYCVSEEVKSRLYVRVLPGIESLTLCMEQGIAGKQILAMQGPFSTELNEAIIRQYRISCLVTKESGRSGGYEEKLEAAKRAGIPVFVVGRPKEDEGYSFSQICERLEELCGQKIRPEGFLEIALAGAGMGHEGSLTAEVRQAIEKADILLGAERLLKPYQPKMEKRPFYRAAQIIPYLKEVQERNPFMESRRVVILFSGDSGFYSGCQALYRALRQETEAGRLKASLRILPGISSVAYLAACIGESYEDAAIYSMHGKELLSLAGRIKGERKTFLLTSGVKDINRLGRSLMEAGMTECEIMTGRQLSYEEQQITRLTPQECCELKEEGLYTCFVKNSNAVPARLTHGIQDEEFIRDRVPMTKEEIREVSICKMRLYKGAVVYDVGSGTGSIAAEIAGLSHDVQVYAIEQKQEAVSLIRKNKEKFQLENISVVEATAPEGLAELPMATHAFIGGSGGRMKEILAALYEINPGMRIVINAVSVETICEIREALAMYSVKNEELVQIQASRAKKAGQYHLMQAENPVWICAFEFDAG